jgi:hypothetical protein
VINQPLEYSKDKFCSYESASGLPLCILTDEQEFHFESVQFASQDKIFVLHKYLKLILEIIDGFVNSSGVSTTYTAIVANRDCHSLRHGQIWILLNPS